MRDFFSVFLRLRAKNPPCPGRGAAKKGISIAFSPKAPPKKGYTESMGFLAAFPLFLFLLIGCASSVKKRAGFSNAPAEEKDSAGESALNLSESLSDTGNLKEKIERDLARKYSFDQDLNDVNRSGDRKKQAGETVFASGGSIDFGDLELNISKRKRDELVRPGHPLPAESRGLSSTKRDPKKKKSRETASGSAFQ